MERKRAVLSVKPRLARALVAGEKRVEFRRARPTFQPGDTIYVYATSPIQAIVGSFICGSISEGTPTKLWRHHADGSEITRAFFRDYFNGSGTAYAIEVRHPKAWTSPLSLDSLRNLIPGFHPPQSYRFLSGELDLGGYS